MKSKCEELSGLHGQLKESRAENSQLTERIRSIEALLEAGQAREVQGAQVSWRLLPGVNKRGERTLSSPDPLCRGMTANFPLPPATCC